MNNKGMLFTANTPNFCDIQQELCDTMDTLLAQMEAQNNIQRLQVIDTDPSETLRWANTASRGRSNQRGVQQRSVGFSRPSQTPGKQQPSRKICEYCQALGKDERIWSTHDKMNCYDLFPEKRRSRVNARMLSVPVMTDENDVWDLQDAFEVVENQFYNQAGMSNELDGFSPQ